MLACWQGPAGGMLSSHATYKTLFLTKMFVGNARTGDNEGVTHNYNLQTVYKVVAVTGGPGWPIITSLPDCLDKQHPIRLKQKKCDVHNINPGTRGLLIPRHNICQSVQWVGGDGGLKNEE